MTTTPLNVLLVEDSEYDAQLVLEALTQAGFDVSSKRIQTSEELRDALTESHWQLVLIDYSLPSLEAPDVLRAVAATGRDLPCIVVSGTIGEESAVGVLRSGAADFLLKDSLARLGPAIIRELKEADQRRRRRAAEDALRESESSFRALFAANPLPMWVYDAATLAFLEVNDAAEAKYGYTRAEFLRMRITQIRPEEDVPHLLRHVAGARDAFEHSGTWRHRLKSGRIIDVEISSHTLPFAGRTGVLVAVRDITDRVEAQHALDERNRVTALIADIGVALNRAPTLDMCLQRSAEAVVQRLDAAFARVWTLNPGEEILELRASAGLYTHLDGAHGLVPVGAFKIGRIARDRRPHLTNEVIGDPEVGDQEWARREGMVAFAGHPLLVGDRVVGVLALFARQRLAAATLNALGAIADQLAVGIARYQSEAVARVLQERMRFALEATQVGIWESDIVTGAVRWSEIAEALHGLSTGTFGGTFDAFKDCIHPDDRQSALDSLGRATRMRGDTNIVYRTMWPDGSIHWINAVGQTQYDEGGHPVRATGICVDISARRALEEHGRQAQKMDALGQLAGGVAHDFNNLLTAILGYGELLLKELREDDPNRADVGEIVKAGESAAKLTAQLLAFSRRQVMQPKVISANDVIQETQRLLARVIGERIQIVAELDPDIACVRVDPGQLEQVVMNLAVNARDAMPGGGRLTIATANRQLDEPPRNGGDATPGRYVQLQVSDTGTGMSADVRAHLFEPFFTTKPQGKGTGIGLATVYGIVKQSGGFIEIDSEVGRGTTFTICLPATEVPKSDDRAGRGRATVRHGFETILVVEDNDAARKLARTALGRFGYRVLEAASGESALGIVNRQRGGVDLVVTDLVMPGITGVELSRKLRDVHPEVRILFTSGYSGDSAVDLDAISDVTAFLPKPYTLESLAKAVRDALDT